MTSDVKVSLGDRRPLDIAELGPLDLKTRIPSEGYISDFRTNVLPFSVTIRPDKQSARISCLGLDILGYRFFVLRTWSATSLLHGIVVAYLIHGDNGRGIKQATRWTRVPLSILLIEVQGVQVTNDTGHRH